MPDDVIAKLLPALDLAVFERARDGSFRPIASVPAWFAELGRDGTFPFLGHILDEARAFWGTARDGVREWGPCAEVDSRGREFHFRVRAVTIGYRAYLVFELDTAAERIRDILQKVRSEALDAARDRKVTEPSDSSR